MNQESNALIENEIRIHLFVRNQVKSKICLFKDLLP